MIFFIKKKKKQKTIFSLPALKNNDTISGLLLRLLYYSQQIEYFLGIWVRVSIRPSGVLYMLYSRGLLGRLTY